MSAQPANLVDVAAETVRDEHLGEMVDLRSLRLLGRLLDLIDGRLPPPLEEVVVVVLFTAPAVKERCSHRHRKKCRSHLRRLLRVRGFLARREGEILVACAHGLHASDNAASSLLSKGEVLIANLPQQPLLLLQVRERLESTVHLISEIPRDRPRLLERSESGREAGVSRAPYTCGVRMVVAPRCERRLFTVRRWRYGRYGEIWGDMGR